MSAKKNRWKRPHFTTGRVIMTLASVLVQVLWITALFIGVIRYSLILDVLLRILSVFMVLYLIRKNDSPAYRMSWIILIAVLPVLGGLLYLLFGNKRPARYLAHHLRIQTAKQLGKISNQADVGVVSPQILKQAQTRLGGVSSYLLNAAHANLYGQTEVRYFENGETAFPKLLKRLREAKQYIFIEFFIMKDGEMLQSLLEVLQQKAQLGLDVRIIFDDFGCMTTLPVDFVQKNGSARH